MIEQYDVDDIEIQSKCLDLRLRPESIIVTRLFSENIKSKQVMVVSNTTVAPLYLEKVIQSLEGFSVDSVILADGEQYKTLDAVNEIITALLESDR